MGFDWEEWALDSLDGAKLSGVKEINARCPFGDCGKAQKLYVNRRNGAFICFSCKRSGRTGIALFAEVEGVTFKEAAATLFRGALDARRKGTIQELIEQVGSLDDEDDDEPKVEVFAELPDKTIPIFEQGRTPKEWRVPVYLRERGITRESAKFWGLGFCKGGRFEGRLVIPIDCPAGRSFTARDMTGELQPKYLNPTGVDHRKLLFGWQSLEGSGDFVICEGPLDAIKLRQAGFPAVALLGKALLDAKLRLLCKIPKDAAAIVMLDPEASVEANEAALALTVHFERVFVATLPAGSDPGDASVEAIRKAVDEAKPFSGSRSAVVGAALAASRSRLKSKF
jgi:DNA primase